MLTNKGVIHSGHKVVRFSSNLLPTFIDRLVVGESQSSFYSEKWIFCNRPFRC